MSMPPQLLQGWSPPAASKSKTLWEHIISFLENVRTASAAFLTIMAAALVVWLLWVNYWDKSPIIGELAVPDSLKGQGYTSNVAGRRLKDALVSFEKATSQRDNPGSQPKRAA